MNTKKFSEAMNELDNRYVEKAINYQARKRKPVWVKWGAVAACFCLMIVAAGIFIPFMKHQDTISAPMITIMGKDYIAPHMPVEALPEEYHYFRNLTKKEANDTKLEGCAIYVNPQDVNMSIIYLYQKCGTTIDDDTVDNTQHQWAYVQWILVE